MQARNPLAKNAAKTPVEIVDVWNSYAQQMPDGTIIRGMAGRVHFYDNPNRRQAVKVDGDLTVFVFDGRETDPSHAKPLKVFQIEADTLDQYYLHQEPFGHGYNFFLPMDEIDGEDETKSPYDLVNPGKTFEYKSESERQTVSAKGKPPMLETLRNYKVASKEL